MDILPKNNQNRIVIEEKRSKYLVLLIGCSPFVVAFLFVFLSGEALVESGAGLLFFGAGIIIAIWKLFGPLPSIVFTREAVTILLSNRTKTVIPWGEIVKVGTQTAGVKFFNTVIDSDYLVLTFANPSNYVVNLGRQDRMLFQTLKDFNPYIGDVKGNFYVLFSNNLNVSESAWNNLPTEFKDKLSIHLDHFPYLLKTESRELYEQEKVREAHSFEKNEENNLMLKSYFSGVSIKLVIGAFLVTTAFWLLPRAEDYHPLLNAVSSYLRYEYSVAIGVSLSPLLVLLGINNRIVKSIIIGELLSIGALLLSFIFQI